MTGKEISSLLKHVRRMGLKKLSVPGVFEAEFFEAAPSGKHTIVMPTGKAKPEELTKAAMDALGLGSIPSDEDFLYMSNGHPLPSEAREAEMKATQVPA